MDELTEAQAQALHAALLALKEQLEQQLQQAESAAKPVQLDQTLLGRVSRMDAMQKQNMELATEQRRQQRLQIIAAALQRIEAGDFGYCILCDEAIAPQRLAFDPAVACCIQCRA